MILYSCTAPKGSLKKEISVDRYKERALCNCIVWGLDSSRNNLKLQSLIPYNPVDAALYDSIIIKGLYPVFIKINNDSILKTGRVSEAALKKDVFGSCMKFYKSKELQKQARHYINTIKRTSRIDSIVANRYPTW